MAFVSEYASAADIEKYNLQKVSHRYGMVFCSTLFNWTVDKTRDIYLVGIGTPGGPEAWLDNPSDRIKFFMYWKGTLFDFWTIRKEDFKESGRRIDYYNISGRIPDEINNQRQQVIADIKEALIAYKYCGASSIRSQEKYTVHCHHFN